MCCLTKWKESSRDVYVHQIITMYLQIAVKRREAKSKGEKERYKHLNAEFQRIVRRDKKALLSDQCKEIEENNRMEKTRDLFKKIRDTEGTFHAKMGSIKDRNCMDLTEAVQVRCRIQDAWGWCTGMKQRNGMGREVGRGFRIRNTCTPVADSC